MVNNRKKGKTLNKETITSLVILIILSAVSVFTMDIIFAAALIGGILLILGVSALVNKLKKKKALRIIINILSIIFLLACIAGIAGVAWFFNYVVKQAPTFDQKQLYKSQTSQVYDKYENLWAEIGAEKREIITYNQMSETFVDAIVATEDSRFFQHNGFDAARFGVAFVKQILGDTGAGGASTLTMQVVGNVFTDRKEVSGFEGIVRKFTDIYLAVFKIEEEYSKQEIIEFYANIHFLGSNSNGVEQAAKTYFGKNASDLSLAEASVIAGLFKAPGSYDPFKKPEAAEARRKTVLNLMARHGYITKEEQEIALSIPVESLLVNTSNNNQANQAYLNLVIEESIDKYGVNPYNTSMKIYTNMDPDKQTALDKMFSGETYNWENPEVQAGVAAVDVWSGKIIAIGAGRGRDQARTYSFASDSKRQVGSTAKPVFDYAPGMEYNNWSTYTLFDDSKYYYTSGQEIRNSDRGYMGIITLKEAIAQSRNIPALKAFQQVDNKKIIDFVTKLGIKPEIENGYIHEAHSIGSFTGSNPLEMAAAYAAFANGGYYYEPYAISKIVFRDTNEVLNHEADKVRVMSDSTAFMITESLKYAVTNGLSSVAKVNGVNVAAKTGTTNYTEAILRANGLPNTAINDAWVIGYDPNVSIGLWYGYEPINKTYYTTAVTAANQRKALFNAIGNIMFEKNGKDFAVPASVIKVAVEFGTDPVKLASAGTPAEKIRYEYFKVGTEPTEVSNAYLHLSNASGLNAKYDPSTLSVNISWMPAPEPSEKTSSYGPFGYNVYKDGSFLGFTTEPRFTLSNISQPSGTYTVVTSYEQYTGNSSSGISTTLNYEDTSKYTATLNVPNTKTYNKNDSLLAHDLKPTKEDIKLLKDGVNVTNEATVSITITNNTGSNTTIDTSDVNEFKIVYSISYNGKYNTKLTRTVKVVEPTPPSTP